MRSSTPILAVAVVLASLVAYSAVPDPVQAAPMTRPAITQEECPKNVNQPGASCGRIEVPTDYASPNGQKIDIGFVKTTASKFEKRRGTLFVNPGGPGGSVYNLFTLQNSAQGSPETSPQWPTEVREEWDIVAVQPRGLEGSTKLDCGEVNAGPLDQVRRFGGLINDACNAKMPGYAATLTTENTARDWDMVRQALGEEKISIYGMSYGTFLGSVYATMYPEHTDKVVLDAGLNPDNDMSESIPSRIGAFHDFFGWVSQHDDVYHMGTTPRAVYKSWAYRVKQETGVSPTLPPPAAEEEDVPEVLGFTGSAGAEVMTRVDPMAVHVEWTLTQLTHLGAKQNESESLRLVKIGTAFPSWWPALASIIARPEPITRPHWLTEAMSDPGYMSIMVACHDRVRPLYKDRLIAGMWGQMVTGDPLSETRLYSSGVVCSGIPVDHPAPEISGEKLAVKPLQIQGTGDPATPYRHFSKMSAAMRSHVLTVDGPGHVQIYTDNPQLGHVITEYLRTGTVEHSRIAGMDPKPGK